MALVLFLAAVPVGNSIADGLLQLAPASVPPFSDFNTVFPNWVRAPLASYMVTECDDAVCTLATTSAITGLTIYNYGSATGGGGGDLTNLYWQLVCGAINSGQTMMVYAGVWTVDGSPVHAWTWAGSFNLPSDPCASCLCNMQLMVYGDVGPCPTDGATIGLGVGYNPTLDAVHPGGMSDSRGYFVPWMKAEADAKTIRYVMKKANIDTASPGDTVNYTVYYGSPGTGSIGTVWITDTLPAYTHWNYVASVAPDPGWDPNPGPPASLRWSLAGGPTTGGPTNALSFQVTVDWGNLESFEPGSGDVGAPEGSILANRAHFAWDGSGCQPGRTSNAPNTVVKRYMFWMIGDNDVLFAPRMGMPDDEMTYEIFVRNISTTRTWWNVSIWDTVPDQIDSWSFGYGFYDPTLGWTMTPTGAAAASPGKVVTGGKTILTWTLDMPPGTTLMVHWRGRLKNTTAASTTVVNKLSILEKGKSGIADGTGHASTVKGFIHAAQVVLRIVYTSYVGFWAAETATCNTPASYFISLYPLNKVCDFSMYTRFCCGAAPCDTACDPFAITGGVSPPINNFAGTCTGGGGGDWETGCKAERSPARFVPSEFVGTTPNMPFNLLHKLVSNSPVIWELATCFGGGNQDASTYVGTTSLTFCGYLAYTYVRMRTFGDEEDFLYLANTSDTAMTTAHVFRWNSGSLAWDYMASKDILADSQWAYIGPSTNHYRIVSSDTQLIVHKAYAGVGNGGAYNDFGTFVPNRENGNLVNNPATLPATFYLWAGHNESADTDVSVVVQNVGAATATYKVWRYQPLDTSLPSIGDITPDLVDRGGTMIYLGSDTVPPGMIYPANPHIYGQNYDPAFFLTRFRFYKLQLVSGGPIQVTAGVNPYSAPSGGAVGHSSDPPGSQVGSEFYGAHAAGYGDCSVNLFCPKKGMVVRAVDGRGYSATYTTDDIDECVAFHKITLMGNGSAKNYRINVLPVGNVGDGIFQYGYSWMGEKFYAAPFLSKGVFYAIIAPPVVYSGESFWITVVVMDSGGGTKTDYCGTSSFTSTDPTAKIEGAMLDAYNFTWSSASACSSSPDENGVRVFVNVTFNQIGMNTLVATDITDGSINGLVTLMVVGVDVKLWKEPRLATVSSGDTVEFKICWSNYSSASALSFVITDAVPVGTIYVPQVASSHICGTTSPISYDFAYATATSSAAPASGWVTTTGTPVSNTYWLRWTIRSVGVDTTGCACFRVSVK